MAKLIDVWTVTIKRRTRDGEFVSNYDVIGTDLEAAYRDAISSLPEGTTIEMLMLNRAKAWQYNISVPIR